MTDDDDLDWMSRVLDPDVEIDRQVADIVRHARRGGRISRDAHRLVWLRLGPLLGPDTATQAETYLRYAEPDKEC
jgi:hypothetical protein